MTHRPFVLLLFAATALAAQERILVPINYNGPGARGSVWTSHVRIINYGSEALNAPGVVFRDPTCPANEACPTDTIRAGLFGWLDTPAPNGLILYAPAGVTLSNRVINAGPAPLLTEAAEVPFPRENDFKTTQRFALVPSQSLGPSPTRAMLRLYSLDAPDGTLVRIRFRSQTFEAPTIFPDVIVRLGRPTEETAPPRFPAYAQVDLFSELRGRGAIGDLTIEGVDSPVPLWGFISITNEIDNSVAILSPN